MSKPPFLDAIQNQILVCDGAVGTQLRGRIPPYIQCLSACNIHQDYFHIVQNIHQEYRTAGADTLQTNTFSANATKLKNYGFEMQVAEINRAGAVLAREVAGNELYVAGSVGPLEMDALGEDLSSKQMRHTISRRKWMRSLRARSNSYCLKPLMGCEKRKSQRNER